MSGDVPVLTGFRVERDQASDGWIATSRSGTFTIRGRSQAELDAARQDLYVREMVAFRAAMAEVFPPDRRIR